MANPLQKKKVKNPSRKVSRKGKNAGKDRAKKVSFANTGIGIIAANWDKNLTLRQNYQRMGLTPSLNGKAGGQDPSKSLASQPPSNQPISIEYRSVDDFNAMPSISIAASTTTANASTVDDSDRPDPSIEEPIVVDPRTQAIGTRLGLRYKTIATMGLPAESTGTPETLVTKRKVKPLEVNVADALEQEASLGEAPRHTHSSAQEVSILERLQKKYASDYEAMARDRKLNPYQFSAGQLKRRFKKANMAE